MCRWSRAEHTHAPPRPTGGATCRAAGCYGPWSLRGRCGRTARRLRTHDLSPRPTRRPIALTPPSRLMLLLAVAACAFCATATPASASRNQITILQDDAQLIGANG